MHRYIGCFSSHNKDLFPSATFVPNDEYMTIAVLGAGMVGRAIALDLANDYTVTSFDVSAANLEVLIKEILPFRQ